MKFLNIEYRDRFPIKKPVPDLLQLCVDNLGVYNFRSPIADVVHPADPLHRLVGFQCLRDTFCLGHLLYQLREHFLRLTVDIGKVTVQFLAGEQRRIGCPSMILQVTPVALSLDAGVYCFFLRQFQTGQIIVPLQLIPKPVLLVIDVLVHFVILQCD